MILPTLFQMVMRGADGVGWSGEPPWWGPFAEQSASGRAPASSRSCVRLDRLLPTTDPG